MARRPDFDQLVLGVLYFPSKGEEDDPRLRYADARTWADWASVGRAELWQLVALSVNLDPQFMPWREIDGLKKSASGLFAIRLEAAAEAMALGKLPPAPGASDDTVLGQTLVRVVDFVRWAQSTTEVWWKQLPVVVRLPASFPSGDSLARPPAARTHVRRQLANAAPVEAFVRQRELLAMVPFSAATLWRKVKDKTFVQPQKLSAGVTAWRRDEVVAWVKAQPETGKRRPRKVKANIAT